MDIYMDRNKVNSNYNSAKIWQIGLFVLNNAASNIAFFLMLFYGFFTQNVLGLSAAVVGLIAMLMRIFDGITDPIIGFMLDKTDGKFGKFRPFMLAGNIILVVTVLLIYRTPEHWGMQAKYIYTAAIYVVYVIGYTFQTSCTKGAQAALTNDPSQRPLFTLFDSIMTIGIMNGGTFILMSLMAPKYKTSINDPALWKDASLMLMSVSFIFTILAIIGIWEKDRTEYFGLGNNAVKVKFKDTIDVIKNNKPLQMLIVAASTDKLATTAIRGGLVYFFSNMLLNNSLQGKYSMWAIIPTIMVTFIGVNFATKSGIKKSFVRLTWIGAIMLIVLIFLTPVLAKPNFGTGVLILLVVLAVQSAISSLAGSIVIPMIADCADYETYRTGRFMPGLIGTLFSFVDKMISSVATFIIGLAISWAGYGSVKITPNTAVNPKFQMAIIFIVLGLPLIGHIASLISMKFYELDGERMDEIKRAIHKKKSQKNSTQENLKTDGLEVVM